MLLFTARDIVLFYVGWEAMMIPLYVLIAVWGGEQRRRATLTFFIYTLIGSLLMLVAVAWVGIHGNSFELDVLTGRRARLDLAVPGLLRGVLHQGAAVPAARLAADHLPAVVARGDGAARPA